MLVTIEGIQRENPAGCGDTEVCKGGPFPVVENEVLQGMGYTCCTARLHNGEVPDRKPHVRPEHDKSSSESDEDSSDEDDTSSRSSSEERPPHRRPHRRPQRPDRPVVSEDDQNPDTDTEGETKLLSDRRDIAREHRRPSERTDRDRPRD